MPEVSPGVFSALYAAELAGTQAPKLADALANFEQAHLAAYGQNLDRPWSYDADAIRAGEAIIAQYNGALTRYNSTHATAIASEIPSGDIHDLPVSSYAASLPSEHKASSGFFQSGIGKALLIGGGIALGAGALGAFESLAGAAEIGAVEGVGSVSTLGDLSGGWDAFGASGAFESVAAEVPSSFAGTSSLLNGYSPTTFGDSFVSGIAEDAGIMSGNAANYAAASGALPGAAGEIAAGSWLDSLSNLPKSITDAAGSIVGKAAQILLTPKGGPAASGVYRPGVYYGGGGGSGGFAPNGSPLGALPAGSVEIAALIGGAVLLAVLLKKKGK